MLYYFIIWISGCIVKEVIDAVVNVVSLTCRKMCGNSSNYRYHGRVDGAGIEDEVSNDLLAADY